MSDNELSSGDPVSVWIEQLRGADAAAAAHLWRHFVARLQELARRRLKPQTRRVYDEEDAALSAFDSVCAGLVTGRFPDLHDRDSLWRLLLVITSRKIAHRHRYDQQQRRDVRRTLNEAVFTQSTSDALPRIEQAASREPTPEFAAEFAETCENLFNSLDDPVLREVATLRIEGYTDGEVAERMNCSRRTVQRRLEIIRRHWNGGDRE